MEKIERPDAPEWLKEKEDEWGADWAEKYKKTNDTKKFTWRQNRGKGKKHLRKALLDMTENHCSFCDSYPMQRRIQATIEHFKPKTRFPLDAYKWENLFICCALCQEKGDKFDPRLLKPDEATYDFEKYFDIDWTTGDLLPNMDASAEDRERARITINLYRLNSNGKPGDRLEELEKYQEAPKTDINKWSYRFFLRLGKLEEK